MTGSRDGAMNCKALDGLNCAAELRDTPITYMIWLADSAMACRPSGWKGISLTVTSTMDWACWSTE